MGALMAATPRAAKKPARAKSPNASLMAASAKGPMIHELTNEREGSKSGSGIV